MGPDFAKLKPVDEQPNFAMLKPVDNPTTPAQTGSGNAGQDILNSIGEDISGVKQNKSDSFIPSLIKNTVGSQGLAGVAQLPGRVSAAISEYGIGPQQGVHQAENLNNSASDLFNHAADLLVQARTVTDPEKQSRMRDTAKQLIKSANDLQGSAEEIRSFTDTTGSQAAGTTINAALTAATGAKPNILGEFSPAFKPLAAGTSFVSPLARTINYGGRTIENALLGVGFNAASNLEQNKNALDNAGSAALFGAAIPVAGALASTAKGAIQEAAGSGAEGLINSLIKPLQKDFAYGKNPARGIIDEGIVANDLPSLNAKVNSKLGEIGSQIGDVGKQVEASGITLDLTPALTPINSAMRDAAKSNNPALLNQLNNVKIALMHDLSLAADESGNPIISKGNPKNLVQAGYNDAVQFLSDIRDHTRFTGNPSDDKALNNATKQAYGITREIMNTGAGKVDPQLENQIRDLNSRYADLSSARSAIAHRDIVERRQNILDLAAKFSIPVSIGAALLSGSWAHAGTILATEVGGLIANKVLGSATTKTRVAQFLSSLAPQERQGILNSTPVLKSWYERLTGNDKPQGGVVGHVTPESVNLDVKSVGGTNKVPITNSEPPLSPLVDQQAMDMGTYKLGKEKSGRITPTDYKKPGVSFYPAKKK